MIVRDVTAEETSQASELANATLFATISTISEELGCSAISSATLAFQSAILGLIELGGDASKEYMSTVLKEAIKGRETQQTEQRRLAALKKMCRHYDLLVKNPGGEA